MWVHFWDMHSGGGPELQVKLRTDFFTTTWRVGGYGLFW